MDDPGLALLDPTFSRDPYGVFRRLREAAPVLWSPALRRWIVTGYEACRDLLRDPGIGVGRAGYLATVQASVGPGRAFDYVSRRMTTYEPPDHHRLRSAVHGGFTAPRLARLRASVRERAGQLLAACAEEPEGRADLLARVAHPLPSQVICELLGVPEEDRPAFDRWTAALAPLIGPAPAPDQVAAGRAAAEEEWEHVERWLARRRPGTGDDVTASLLAAEAAGGVTREELVATVMFLFSAGHQTTRDLLGNGLWSLLRQRDEWRLLTGRPELVPAAVTEMLRHDTSVTVTIRGADRDLDVAGARIPAGCGIVLALAAANRDPARYPDPDRFLIERPDSRPLSFGGGAHHCLGAALARMEAEAVLGALVTRYPGTRLDAEGAADGPAYRSGLTFRGPLALPVVLR